MTRFQAITAIARIMESTLPSGQRMLLIAYAMHANKAGEAWPAVATLAKKAGLSERTVQRSIRPLVESGHLVPIEWGGRTQRFRVCPAPDTMSPPTRCHPRHHVTPDTMTGDPDTVTPHPDTMSPHPDTVTPDPSKNPPLNPPTIPPEEHAPGGAVLPFPIPVEPAPEPKPVRRRGSAAWKKEQVEQVLEAWPTRSPRSANTPGNVKEALSSLKKQSESIDRLKDVSSCIGLAVDNVSYAPDVKPWDVKRGLPAWAAPFAVLAAHGRLSPRLAIGSKATDASGIFDAAAEWRRLECPPWPKPGAVYRFERPPEAETEPSEAPITREEARRRWKEHRDRLQGLAKTMPDPEAWLASQKEAFFEELRLSPGVLEAE